MESVLRLFPFELLLRGVFPGVFFVASCLISRNGWQSAAASLDASKLVLLVAISPFPGLAIYTVHRSVIYPFIEWWMDHYCPSARFPLISKITVRRLVDRWMLSGDANDRIDNLAEHLSGWGNVAHLQYTSGWCIVAALICTFTCEWRLVLLAVIFLASALVSDWRLRHMFDAAVRAADELRVRG